MAKAEINSGICGFTTTVHARADGLDRVLLAIESECAAVQRLAEQLAEVDPLREVTFRGNRPVVNRLAPEYLRHAACPVPVGIIKAVEVAAGLALPADVTIKLADDPQ